MASEREPSLQKLDYPILSPLAKLKTPIVCSTSDDGFTSIGRPAETRMIQPRDLQNSNIIQNRG